MSDWHDPDFMESKERLKRKDDRMEWYFERTLGIRNAFWVLYWVYIISILAPIFFEV